MLHVFSAALAAFTLLILPAFAGELVNVRAEINCDGCGHFERILVIARDSRQNPVGTFTVTSGGEFDMHGLAEGPYTLNVQTHSGDVLHSETVNLRANSGTLTLHLPSQAKAVSPSAPGTVSLARLQHKVPRKARAEFNESDSRMKALDVQGSLNHLLEAVRLDPEYMEAWNNLGSRYLMLDRPAEAIEPLRRAAELDPSSLFVHTNLAVALLALREYPEAERAARIARRVEAGDCKSGYLLGLALYAQRKFTPEAIRLLESAQEEFPKAREGLAAIRAALRKPATGVVTSVATAPVTPP